MQNLGKFKSNRNLGEILEFNPHHIESDCMCLSMIATRYGVFALGNTSYPHYCGFGKWLDSTLGKLSNGRLTNLGLGDELGDRDAEFRKWSEAAYRQACVEANLDIGYEGEKGSRPQRIITKLVPSRLAIKDKTEMPLEKLRKGEFSFKM